MFRFFDNLVNVASSSVRIFTRALVATVKNRERPVSPDQPILKDSTRIEKEQIALHGPTRASGGFTLDDAKKVLDFEPTQQITPELIEERAKKMFELNNHEEGGSVYLQAKIYSARIRMDEAVAKGVFGAVKPKESEQTEANQTPNPNPDADSSAATTTQSTSSSSSSSSSTTNTTTNTNSSSTSSSQSSKS